MVDQEPDFPPNTQDDSSSESSDEGSSLDLLTLSSEDVPRKGTATGLSEAKRQRQEIQRLIEKETRSVNTWRALVATTMVTIGALACVLTFVFLSNEEELAFSNGVSNTRSFPIERSFASSFSNTLTPFPKSSTVPRYWNGGKTCSGTTYDKHCNVLWQSA